MSPDDGALSSIPDETLVVILSFLCAHDLARLARTARRFGKHEAAPGRSRVLGRSIVDEAARLRVGRCAPPVANWVPPKHDSGCWLRLLRAAELRLAFTAAGPGAEISSDGEVASMIPASRDMGLQLRGSAACDTPEMKQGRHYAEFTLSRSQNYPTVAMGVVWAGVDVSAGGSVMKSPHSWLFDTSNGKLCHAGRGYEWPGRCRVRTGQTVGLLLDIDEGSIAVIIDGDFIGFVLHPGQEYCPGYRHLKIGPNEDEIAPLRRHVNSFFHY